MCGILDQFKENRTYHATASSIIKWEGQASGERRRAGEGEGEERKEKKKIEGNLLLSGNKPQDRKGGP